jgi:hypothetical protein
VSSFSLPDWALAAGRNYWLAAIGFRGGEKFFRFPFCAGS